MGNEYQVIGFLHMEFEGNAVFLSREDHEYGLSKNAIWLSMSKSDASEHQNANDSYAVVEGTFNADKKGHFSPFNGSIDEITLIKRWAKVGDKAKRAER